MNKELIEKQRKELDRMAEETCDLLHWSRKHRKWTDLLRSGKRNSHCKATACIRDDVGCFFVCKSEEFLKTDIAFFTYSGYYKCISGKKWRIVVLKW